MKKILIILAFSVGMSIPHIIPATASIGMTSDPCEHVFVPLSSIPGQSSQSGPRGWGVCTLCGARQPYPDS